MSYDMYFWRQTKHLPIQPVEIVDLLAQDQPVEGIAAFPRSKVRAALKKSFPDIVDGDFDLSWEGAGSYFQVGFGHATEKDIQMIIVTCGFSLLKSEETMNRIIDTCVGL